MSTLYSTTMTSPIRPLTIIANDHAIVAITWDTGSADENFVKVLDFGHSFKVRKLS